MPDDYEIRLRRFAEFPGTPRNRTIAIRSATRMQTAFDQSGHPASNLGTHIADEQRVVDAVDGHVERLEPCRCCTDSMLDAPKIEQLVDLSEGLQGSRDETVESNSTDSARRNRPASACCISRFQVRRGPAWRFQSGLRPGRFQPTCSLAVERAADKADLVFD